MSTAVYVLAVSGIFAAGAVIEWVADRVAPGIGVYLARPTDGDQS